jgi:AcrR family transcriptional regulator
MESLRGERKRAEMRQHVADVAIRLFFARGFDAVSVTEIADAADVARPTVFAYYPRKEDLVFDRIGTVTQALVHAILDADGPPVPALLDRLRGPVALGSLGASPDELLSFWRLVANSRALRARARELAEQMESAIAHAFEERGVAHADICAAFIAAAYRTVNLRAIGSALAGTSMPDVQEDRARNLDQAFAAATAAVGTLQSAGAETPN